MSRFLSKMSIAVFIGHELKQMSIISEQNSTLDE